MAFLRFLPGLWADSRRSFPRTQLAFSIWVPEPLLPPYSQNTHSKHRNPSNSQYSRAAQLMASLSAQPPGCLLVKRVSQASTSLSAQPPRMSARETDITDLDKPICPTAPNVCSRNGYHRPRQAYLPNCPECLLVKRVSQTTSPKKQTPNKTVSRQFCPASVYACSLFRNFHTVFEFAAFGNSFRQFVKVAVLKLYFFKGNMLQIQFFEYTPVEYHICQFYFRKLQM